MSKVSARPKVGDDFFQTPFCLMCSADFDNDIDGYDDDGGDDDDGGEDDDGDDGDDGGDNFSSDAGQKITLCARLVARWLLMTSI